ncbi:uncharacterized protein LOC144705710 [Wolffia australiana]
MAAKEDLAEYRREMMELVRNAPETVYELTLRDLVEISPFREESVQKKEVKEEIKKEISGERRRKGLFGGNLFNLRLFFAVKVGSRVSPKPALKESERNQRRSAAQRRKGVGCTPMFIHWDRTRWR